MDIVALVVGINFVALVAIALLALLPARRWTSRLEKRKVIVHTADGSIDGVLLVTGTDGLVLADATYLGDDEKTEVAGELFVPREKVSFIQVP